MAEYMLYDVKLIKNDATLKDFAFCIYNDALSMQNGRDDDPEMQKDCILIIVWDILADDISRTDIDYENLLYRYREELGGLFYRIQNNGWKIPTIEFFGEKAGGFFNLIVYYYIILHYEEFEKPAKKQGTYPLYVCQKYNYNQQYDMLIITKFKDRTAYSCEESHKAYYMPISKRHVISRKLKDESFLEEIFGLKENTVL